MADSIGETTHNGSISSAEREIGSNDTLIPPSPTLLVSPSIVVPPAPIANIEPTAPISSGEIAPTALIITATQRDDEAETSGKKKRRGVFRNLPAVTAFPPSKSLDPTPAAKTAPPLFPMANIATTGHPHQNNISSRKRNPRRLPDQKDLKHGLEHGFHFKDELPLDVIKMIIGASDLIVTMLFAMTCRSFQESVVWSSIKCIDTRPPTICYKEDASALHGALYRRHELLTSVDTFIMSGYHLDPDLEAARLLLQSVSSTLKTVIISCSYNSGLFKAIPKLVNPDVIEWIDVSASFRLRPVKNKVYSKLTHLKVNTSFSDIPKLVKLCPALEFLSMADHPVPRNNSSFSDQWNSAVSQLQTLPNFRVLSLSGAHCDISKLLNNPDQKTFNHSVVTFIEQNMMATTLRVVRIERESIAEWMLQREFHEPSQGEYWTLFSWCHGHESKQKLQLRFERILYTLIVPKRRVVARKSLGVFLDQFATFIISDDYVPDFRQTVLLVAALDSSGLIDRAKFWFDKLARSTYEKEKAAGHSLREFCLGPNISWAGFLVQGMRAEDWCRKSGFLSDLLDLMKNDSSVKRSLFDTTPGFAALMMSYPELEEYP